MQMKWCVCAVRVVRHLLCCSFLSGHGLILCAAVVRTAESVPSYQAGWKHCLVVLSSAAM